MQSVPGAPVCHRRWYIYSARKGNPLFARKVLMDTKT